MSRPRPASFGLLVVGLGVAGVPLDTAVNIAFPAITAAFDLQVRSIQWIVICYVLTYTSLMLVFGKLGDLLGYRLIFQVGLLISAVAFVLCALAPSFGWLLLFRVLQGIGAALAISVAPALATSLYDERDRSRALGAYAGLFSLAWALGPLLGGALVDRWGWGGVFWFRAPVAVLALMLSGVLPAPERAAGRRFDWLGSGLLAFWISALLLALALAQMPGGGVWLPLGLAIAGINALIVFAMHQASFSEPILRLSLFRDLDFSLLNLMSLAVSLVGFAVLLLVPYHLAGIVRLSATWGGAVLAVSAVGMILGSALAGRLWGGKRQKRNALVGIILVIAATVVIGQSADRSALAAMAVALLCQGIGLGLFQVAYTDIVTGSLPVHDRGVAGSLAMVTRTLGTVASATLLSALFQQVRQAALDGGHTAEAAFLRAFETTFTAAAVFLLITLGATLLRRRMWQS
ncbi:MFS transporter [Vineibacter terrae]|uniref:MFS transporter n=1 Tax=Vineibacter terrae TaxID=2586908 RepID=UPI002E30ED06|nr:MFS transporter [Vineibacter terrae]HEX2887042.1 MFS transporter [Vineibacter terrae]